MKTSWKGSILVHGRGEAALPAVAAGCCGARPSSRAGSLASPAAAPKHLFAPSNAISDWSHLRTPPAGYPRQRGWMGIELGRPCLSSEGEKEVMGRCVIVACRLAAQAQLGTSSITCPIFFSSIYIYMKSTFEKLFTFLWGSPIQILLVLVIMYICMRVEWLEVGSQIRGWGENGVGL